MDKSAKGKSTKKKVRVKKAETTKTTKTTKAQEKLDDLNDKYLRLYSEFDNYRKRTAKEKQELYKTAAEGLMVDLLPILDDFERAIKSSEETDNISAIREGEKLIYNKFKNTLVQKGLEEIDAIGKVFDTDHHEAVTKFKAPSKDMVGKVIDQTEKGYQLNGKVIRYAKVVIGN
ncbi:MAG: nucleotide exchange factor GrpE [Bacteroidales bacterium]|nr:nucleotide exchange factor GrpE [Bacteroidales bacterium]